MKISSLNIRCEQNSDVALPTQIVIVINMYAQKSNKFTLEPKVWINLDKDSSWSKESEIQCG